MAAPRVTDLLTAFVEIFSRRARDAMLLPSSRTAQKQNKLRARTRCLNFPQKNVHDLEATTKHNTPSLLVPGSDKVLNKVMAVLVILKYLTTLDTPRNNMVQRSCGVNAGLSGRVRHNIKTTHHVKFIS